MAWSIASYIWEKWQDRRRMPKVANFGHFAKAIVKQNGQIVPDKDSINVAWDTVSKI